ncbi:MAG: CDP-diacylglycerol--glycerol-3-phosphate 3-phosphatidyltransferase [Planctomycetaceae bacterium]|jgi:CDP-diacylglycerol--glycerol-3-phosphate 3-phosphatidyltransferase|nr:CDP-diacylglycerol--glycerol-3-phosphate 3-phosphatidyltransferase [Planctomycetaceae bacterium]
MNIPNLLTLFRIFFAVEVFVFCAYRNWELCLLFFVLASVTDFFDGWWARKYNQITVFGRIMDPFADKFLICGTFICLLGVPPLIFSRQATVPAWTMLQPWMAVVLVARELFITSLRAVIEKSGGDFSAKWIGKWKMGLQCAALVMCFVYLSFHSRFSGKGLAKHPLLVLNIIWLVLLWATVIITLYSGISYSWRAVKQLRDDNAGG